MNKLQSRWCNQHKNQISSMIYFCIMCLKKNSLEVIFTFSFFSKLQVFPKKSSRKHFSRHFWTVLHTSDTCWMLIQFFGNIGTFWENKEHLIFIELILPWYMWCVLLTLLFSNFHFHFWSSFGKIEFMFNSP